MYGGLGFWVFIKCTGNAKVSKNEVAQEENGSGLLLLLLLGNALSSLGYTETLDHELVPTPSCSLD